MPALGKIEQIANVSAYRLHDNSSAKLIGHCVFQMRLMQSQERGASGRSFRHEVFHLLGSREPDCRVFGDELRQLSALPKNRIRVDSGFAKRGTKPSDEKSDQKGAPWQFQSHLDDAVSAPTLRADPVKQRGRGRGGTDRRPRASEFPTSMQPVRTG